MPLHVSCCCADEACWFLLLRNASLNSLIIMATTPDVKAESAVTEKKHGGKLGTATGVYIPVCLNILSILMFLRFGHILGRVGFIGIIGTCITTD